jgi:hypothetical protein
MISKSMTGSGRKYVVVQGVVREGNILHVQYAGGNINRSYGAAFDVTISPEDKAALANCLRTRRSMAGTARMYTEMQFRAEKTLGEVHFQVSGPRMNRDYGLSFNGVVGPNGTGTVNAIVNAELGNAAPKVEEAPKPEVKVEEPTGPSVAVIGAAAAESYLVGSKLIARAAKESGTVFEGSPYGEAVAELVAAAETFLARTK